MARTEPAIILTFDLACFLAKRHATEMRAHAHQHKKFRPFNTRLVFLRVSQFGAVNGIGAGDFIRRAMANEDRLAAPCDSDCLTFDDLRYIDFVLASASVSAAGFI